MSFDTIPYLLFYDLNFRRIMKTKTVLLVFLTALLLPLLSGGSANAGYSYYIPDIYGASSPYPETAHFDWINNTYTFNDGSNLSFSINFTFQAPDNWSDTPYSTYRPRDNGYSQPDGGGGYEYDTKVNSQMTGGQNDWNDVYSYFYQVQNTGTEVLQTVFIPFDQAAVEDFGYIDDNAGGIDPDLMATAGSQLRIRYSDAFGVGGLDQNDTSEWVYMTSQSWWGWQSLTANLGSVDGTTTLSSLHSSPNGQIPAPNPEAPVLALYVVGLMGMVGYAYMRKRQGEVF
jgi:hypothetical protein